MRYMKKTAITGAIIIGVGIIIGAIGWALGGNKKPGQIVSVNQGKYANKYVKNYNPDQIRNLNVNSSIPVYVTSSRNIGNKTQIKVNADTRNRVHTNVKNGQLTIQSKKFKLGPFDNGKNFTLIGNGYANDSRIIVTVPRDNKLNSIKQNDNPGSINISNVDAKFLSLDGNSSGISLNNVQSDHQIKLDNSSGDININKTSALSLALSNSTGDINVTNSIFNDQRSKISNDSGDTHLVNNLWYALNGYSDSGDVNFSQQNVKNDMRYDNSSGDIYGHIKPAKDISISSNNTNGDNHVYKTSPITKVIKNYVFTNDNGDINIDK